jgi:hypothetical protein
MKVRAGLRKKNFLNEKVVFFESMPDHVMSSLENSCQILHSYHVRQFLKNDRLWYILISANERPFIIDPSWDHRRGLTLIDRVTVARTVGNCRGNPAPATSNQPRSFPDNNTSARLVASSSKN